MKVRIVKKVLRGAGIVAAVPVVLFVLLLVLLYLPPVQKRAVGMAARYASDATGMDIRVGRVRLGFPLDLRLQQVAVRDSVGDTLVAVGELRTGVALLPLLRGEVQVRTVHLMAVEADTRGLITGVAVSGRVGRLVLETGEVNPAAETVEVESLVLQDADVRLLLTPSEEPKEQDTASVHWRIDLHQAVLDRVNFALDMPVDSLALAVGWEQTELDGVEVDLGQSAYGVHRFSLSDGHFTYRLGTDAPTAGLDPSHLDLQAVNVRLDTLLYNSTSLAASLRELQFRERSGLEVHRGEGDFSADTLQATLSGFLLETSASRLQADGAVAWASLRKGSGRTSRLQMAGEVGKRDLLALCGTALPEQFVAAPDSLVCLQVKAVGNADTLTVSPLTVSFDRQTLQGQLALRNTRCEADLRLMGQEAADTLAKTTSSRCFASVMGRMDSRTGTYAVQLMTDSLPLHRYLLDDSLRHLTLSAHAEGQGTDLYAAATRLKADVLVSRLEYGTRCLSDMTLHAGLEKHRAELLLQADNPLFRTDTHVEAFLHRDSLSATLRADIPQADLTALQLTEVPLLAALRLEATCFTDFRHTHAAAGRIDSVRLQTPQGDFSPKDVRFDASVNADATRARVEAGDLALKWDGQGGVEQLADGFSRFVSEAVEQLDRRMLDPELFHTRLPRFALSVKAGEDNPVSNYLRYAGAATVKSLALSLASTEAGIHGDGTFLGVQRDSLLLDTVTFSLRQDTSTVTLRADVYGTPPGRSAFMARMEGHLQAQEADVLLRLFDERKRLGLELGVGAQHEVGGMRFRLLPEQPTVAFRPFTLNEGNFFALSDSGRVTADISLLDKDGTGVRLYSSPHEEALQDLTLDIARLRLGEVLGIFPYLPAVNGTLDTELHWVQLPESMTFSGTSTVEGLDYEGTALGDIGLEAVYLPMGEGRHTVSLQLLRDETEVLAVDGSYADREGGVLDGEVRLEHFPLDLTDAFLPRELVTLDGAVNGTLTVRGLLEKLRFDGELAFAQGQLESPLYALQFTLDDQTVKIADGRMLFDSYRIYARGNNPFTLDGSIDFADFSRMTADLRMRAMEYELLNAKQNKNSLLYGKVFVSLFSSIKGLLSAPTVRGTMNVLGKTDVTYVLKDSPLSVDDRLGSLVTFTNFADTVEVALPEREVSLGGLDMMLNVQIDEGAQVQVDLTDDNYVKLQGGGNLSLQYTPQGELLLTGRYTLTSGEMKYSLPIIPLKTFDIANGSYVEFTGDPTNPYLQIKATERVRTTVTEDNASRYVNFDVGVAITNSLDDMGLEFTLAAPEDVSLQNTLAAMSAEERGKLAVTMLVTGMYAGGGGTSGGFSANNALNSFLQSEISNIAGSALKTVDISIGVEDNYASDGSSGGTDYSFRFAKRFWNNRLSVIIGGRISTGNEVTAEEEGNSFIDDVSLEWRLDDSGTRYVKLFHNKNYESILEGEITETGVGLVLRRKINKLGELFVFRKKKKNNAPLPAHDSQLTNHHSALPIDNEKEKQTD